MSSAQRNIATVDLTNQEDLSGFNSGPIEELKPFGIMSTQDFFALNFLRP